MSRDVKPLARRACSGCGTHFQPVLAGECYCSDECRARRWEDAAPAAEARTVWATWWRTLRQRAW